MSWDVVIFSSKQKIDFIEEIDDELFVPVDFNEVLKNYFNVITSDEKHRTINGPGFSIEYFADGEPASNVLFQLYGEAALYELVKIARIHHWQIYDTGIGAMLHLDHPEKNGYNNFQAYLQQVLGSNPNDDGR